MAASGLIDCETAVMVPALVFVSTPLNFSAGTPVANAMKSCAAEFGSRRKICVSSTHGWAWPSWPKPNAKYAPSELMAVWLDAVGTIRLYVLTGPWKSPMSAGSAATPGHEVAALPMFAKSMAWPATGRVHVSSLPVVSQ